MPPAPPPTSDASPGPDELYRRAEAALQRHWGYPGFRPGQDRAVRSVLEGRRTLVLFPTGGGKSLCFQVPALVLPGLTLVISPLIALMQDQVEQLGQAGVSATFLNGTLSTSEIEQRLLNARNGLYRLLYLAPERLPTALFQAELDRLDVSMVAVDEAHCISEWGHDFRPSYRQIRDSLQELPDAVRWMALTATATPEVKRDILDSLRFENPEVVALGFARKNLTWWVNRSVDKRRDLPRVVRRANRLGSGIVYAPTRAECESWAARFTRMGIPSRPYHAGLEPERRSTVQQEWISGQIPLVVATNAFGMGIDKPDCRYVIHYQVPSTLEAFYQEAGRAGRDGQRAWPVLLYDPRDAVKVRDTVARTYPDHRQLERLYQCLCDELGLALGEYRERAEPVSPANLARRVGRRRSGTPPPDLPWIAAGLRILQRLEVIEFTEQGEPEVSVVFGVGRAELLRTLSRFEPAKAEFVDRLMRLFGAEAFGEGARLRLDRVMGELQVGAVPLRRGLQVLQDHDGLLRFGWHTDEPWIRVVQTRQRSLPFGADRSEAYRRILLEKADYVRRYAETAGCREQFLRAYFGETGVEPCGACDLCVRGEGVEPAPEERSRLVVGLLESHGPLTMAQIAARSGIRVKEIRTTLGSLAREEQVRYETTTGAFALLKEGKA